MRGLLHSRPWRERPTLRHMERASAAWRAHRGRAAIRWRCAGALAGGVGLLLLGCTVGQPQAVAPTAAPPPSPAPTDSAAPMTTEVAMRAYAQAVLAPRTSLGPRIAQTGVTVERVDCLAGAALRQRLNEVAADGRDYPDDVTRCVIVLSGHFVRSGGPIGAPPQACATGVLVLDPVTKSPDTIGIRNCQPPGTVEPP